MKISKVIIPAAGLGTRFLPITKSVPKELLPVLNKPALQLIVQEALASDVQENIIVVSPSKKDMIAHYFNQDTELDAVLSKNNKESVLFDVKKLIEHCSFEYPVQTEPRGLGHALLQGRPYIGNEFFAVMLPDDIIVAPKNPALEQLKIIAQTYQSSAIAVQKVPVEQVSSYGIISIRKQLDSKTFSIHTVVEKPTQADAPSEYAVVGRYIFDPILFEYLEKISPGAHKEIQLTDAIAAMIKDGYPVVAHVFEGTRFDLGTPPGWLEANLYFAKQSPDFSGSIL